MLNFFWMYLNNKENAASYSVLEKWENINKPGVKPEYLYEVDMIMSEDYCPEEHYWISADRMPADAIRLFLKVTNVRSACLLDITPDDYRKEGYGNKGISSYLTNLRKDLVKTCPEIAEEENPMLWIVEFELIHKVEELKIQYEFIKETHIMKGDADNSEVLLIDATSGETLLQGDCYHDKINILIDGFLRGLTFAGISYSVVIRIVETVILMAVFTPQ